MSNFGLEQFLKKENKGYERYVNFVNNKELEYLDIPFDMKKFTTFVSSYFCSYQMAPFDMKTFTTFFSYFVHIKWIHLI